MSRLIRTTLLLAALCGAATLAGAQQAASAGPAASATTSLNAGAPAGFVAPAAPRPDDSNAERAKSQPGNNAPLWRSVRESGTQPGLSSLPGAEKGVLVQPFVQYPGSRLTNAGEAWRQVRNRWLIPYGGALLLIVSLAIGLFYWRKGALGGHVPDTGRQIERFTPLERSAHWVNAGAFCVLAISGIVMAFGKFFLLPIIGHTLFGWLTWLLKTAHNFAGPLFAVSLVVVIVTFVKDNIANKADFVWLSRAGGMLGDQEVPSHRFNAGEKGMFWWGVTVPGLVVVGSGLVLDQLLPNLAYLRGDMQLAHLIHASAAIIMMVILTGHIYMGTIGVKGAYTAMKTGYVDEGWAKEHHVLWHDDIVAGKIPAQRSAQPAPAAEARPRPA
jgi:formate dehydrogenase subunit gamma